MTICYCLAPYDGLTVPHSESGVAPMSSLLGVEQLGSGKLERVEQLGEAWGK